MTRYNAGDLVWVRTKHYGPVEGVIVKWRPSSGTYLVRTYGTPTGRVDTCPTDIVPRDCIVPPR